MLKSLEKAFLSSNSIVLPNFGGLMKMGNSFIFNEFLKFNDGKLSKFLQEAEKLNKEDADAKITSFITEIQDNLNSQGSFSLGTIGVLVMKDGKIKLEKNTTTSPQTKKAIAEPVKKVIPTEVVKPKKEALKPTIKNTESKPAQKEKKPTEIIKKEVAKLEIKETPVQKAEKEINNLSINFTVKEAQEKINKLTDKQEIITFTKGDTRKTIVTALNQKLKSLNKIDITELDILEATKVEKDVKKAEKDVPIKEGTTKEVKKQVAKESDILKTVIEKEKVDNLPKQAPKTIEKDSKPLPKKEIEAATVKNTETKEEVKPEVKKESKVTSEEEDLVALTDGAIKLEKEAKGRKRNKIILWIAIICILSGGGIVGYLKQDAILGLFESSELIAENEKITVEKEIPTEPIQESEISDISTEEENIKTEDTTTIDISNVIPEEEQALSIDEEIIEEEIIEETVEIVEPIEETSVPTIETGKYYVVVGSFSKEKNALNLVKALKEEGFNKASIFQNGSLQSVTLGIYPTSSEAKKILKESGKEGWVKKPR